MTPHELRRCGIDAELSFWCVEPDFISRLWIVFYYLIAVAAGNIYSWIMGPQVMNEQMLNLVKSIDKLISCIVGRPYSLGRERVIKSVASLENYLSAIPRMDYDMFFFKPLIAIDQLLQRYLGLFYKLAKRVIWPWCIRFILLICVLLGSTQEYLRQRKHQYIDAPYSCCYEIFDTRYKRSRRYFGMTDWHLQRLKRRRDLIGFFGAFEEWMGSTSKAVRWHIVGGHERTAVSHPQNRGTLAARVTASQEQCTLLSRLPLELREMIYRETLTSALELCIGDVGEPVLKPYRGSSRGEILRRETPVCRSTKTNRKAITQRGRLGHGRSEVPRHSQRTKTSALSGKTLDLSLQHGKISLLRSCRAM